MRKHRRLMLVTVLVAMSALVFSMTPQASQASGAWSVEIVSGENVISLTQADLEKMSTVAVTAGFRKSGGKVEGPFEYKGVYMKDLLDKVGGIKKGQSLKVTSRDGYVRDFSHLEVTGNILTYDQDGNLLRLGNTEMLLTYESDRDAPIAFPRIIYVSENDKLSVTLDSQQIAKNNDIFVANKKDGLILSGEMYPLTLAGKGLPFKQYMIKGIAEIQLVNLPKK